MCPPSDRRPHASNPTRRRLPLALALALIGGGAAPGAAPAPALDPARVAAGRELFHREWRPMDPRSHGGDGVGPVYNEASCVACHQQGGPGGAGPAGLNVDLLTLDLGPSGMAMAMESDTDMGMGVGSLGPVGFGRSGRSGRSGMGGLDAGLPSPGLKKIRSELMTTPLLSRLVARSKHINNVADDLTRVFSIYPGFREASTISLHRLGTDPTYKPWREAQLPGGAARGSNAMGMPGMMGMSGMMGMEGMGMGMMGGMGDPRFRPPHPDQIRVLGTITVPASFNLIGTVPVVRTQRNTTPLFGLGLIDAIPESAILANAARQADTTTATAGRASRLKDGRIGRFGWKGQTAGVADFVLDACATEVGLEVPGRSQGVWHHAPAGGGGAKPGGLDLTADECASLTAFVESLPRPRLRPLAASEAGGVAEGQARFAAIGCADCHTPDLGGVDGLYSDLLLHDMGNATAASGSYGGGSPGETDDRFDPILARRQLGPVERGPDPKAPAGARAGEWRTPPLWGLRQSGPYLHDGRAETLEQAIAAHGGQGTDAARRYFELRKADRAKVQAFLRSLVAPANAEPLAMR